MQFLRHFFFFFVTSLIFIIVLSCLNRGVVIYYYYRLKSLESHPGPVAVGFVTRNATSSSPAFCSSSHFCPCGPVENENKSNGDILSSAMRFVLCVFLFHESCRRKRTVSWKEEKKISLSVRFFRWGLHVEGCLHGTAMNNCTW